MEYPKHHKNFKVENRLVYLVTDEAHNLCLPNVTHNRRRVWELIIDKAHSLLAHLRFKKTLTYV